MLLLVAIGFRLDLLRMACREIRRRFSNLRFVVAVLEAGDDVTGADERTLAHTEVGEPARHL